MRLLLWLVMGLIVYFAIRSKVRRMREEMRAAVKAEFDAGAANQNQHQNQNPQRAAIPAEDMVACAHCHLYLPASEAIHLQSPSSGQFFCCEEHLRMHANQSSASNKNSTHE